MMNEPNYWMTPEERANKLMDDNPIERAESIASQYRLFWTCQQHPRPAMVAYWETVHKIVRRCMPLR